MNCRRCGDCIGAEHHWLPYEPDEDDPLYSPVPDYCCKHCPAIGDECPACQGEGTLETILNSRYLAIPVGPGRLEDCPTCRGYGVIERKGVEL